MFPPIFATCAASPGVTALLGASPTRLYPFGEAPQGVACPYAVWQTVGGSPENCLGSPPDIDSFVLQVDVYAETGAAARLSAIALRDSIELKAHIIRWGGESKDPETGRYRVSFDVGWHVSR